MVLNSFNLRGLSRNLIFLYNNWLIVYPRGMKQYRFLNHQWKSKHCIDMVVVYYVMDTIIIVTMHLLIKQNFTINTTRFLLLVIKFWAQANHGPTTFQTDLVFSSNHKHTPSYYIWNFINVISVQVQIVLSINKLI